MIRKAFVMQVNPDSHGEYQKRHDEVWPELSDTLKSHGVHNYSIFLQKKTNQLFAYVEIDDEEQWKSIASTEICQKWWKYMRDIMPTDEDNRPLSIELSEMFHMD